MTVDELITWLKTEQHVFMLDAHAKKIIIDALLHYQSSIPHTQNKTD